MEKGRVILICFILILILNGSGVRPNLPLHLQFVSRELKIVDQVKLEPEGGVLMI